MVNQSNLSYQFIQSKLLRTLVKRNVSLKVSSTFTLPMCVWSALSISTYPLCRCGCLWPAEARWAGLLPGGCSLSLASLTPCLSALPAAFAELQTDMSDLTSALEHGRVIIHEHKTYVLNVLFPGVHDHPVGKDMVGQPWLPRWAI